MKEKKYHLQEDHGAAFAEEPTPAYHENTTVVLPGKKIAEDNFDDDFEWDRIPAGWGPINEEEARRGWRVPRDRSSSQVQGEGRQHP